jgi:hypothetical protein
MLILAPMTSILYITGRGGSLQKGLAIYLAGIADEFGGVAVSSQFLRQEPVHQVQIIQEKIKEEPTKPIIANSYGAYLTLLALIGIDVTPDKVLLLSPVLGAASAKDRMYYSRPPLTNRLEAALSNNTLIRPKVTKLIMGDQDELYSPERISTIDSYFGMETAQIVAGEGHMLSQHVVQEFINNNLRTGKCGG